MSILTVPPSSFRTGSVILLTALLAGCSCNAGPGTDPNTTGTGTGTGNPSTTNPSTTGPVTGTTVGDAWLTLNLDEPASVDRSPLPLRTGVPFPQGMIDASLPLGLSVGGEVIPAQTKITSVWDDGSVRWMQFDATLPVGADANVRLDVVTLAEPLVVPDPLDIVTTADLISVNTGPLQVDIPLGDGRVFSQIWHGGVPMLDESAEVGPYVRSQGVDYRAENLTDSSVADGGDAVADADPDRTLVAPWPLSVTVEEMGPIHGVVRVSGAHLNPDGSSFSTFITRLHFTRGSARIRVDHTLVYTGADGEGIDGYGFAVPLVGTSATVEGTGSSELQHLEADSYTVDGNSQSGHALGTVAVDIGDQHASLVLRDMAELFPKALAVDGSGIDVQLYPEDAGTWTLSRYSNSIDSGNGESNITRNRGAQGFSRTDTFLIQFGSGAQNATQTAQLGMALDAGPVLALPDAQWISDARVMGVGPFVFPVDPASPGHYRIDRHLQVVADFMRVNQRSEYGWYGHEDYGDIRGDFDGGNASFTWRGTGRYGFSGNSGEPSNQLWLQYLRRPDQQVLRDAEALARHTLDQQMIHYGDADRTDDTDWNGRNRESAVGSLHRHGRQAYSGYGGQPEYSHVSGVETWYYLSGDLRAKDAMYEAAVFIEQYGESRPDWTAMVNGIDVLSRAEAVFWDSAHAARFAQRNDVLLQSVEDDDEVNALLDESNDLPFGVFVRGIPGLAYHHERTGDSRAADGIFDAADRISGASDPYDLWGDGQNGGEFFHMLPLAYAISIAADPSPYEPLAAEILSLNCHDESSGDASEISDASLQAIPSDWRDWTFDWEEDPISAGAPGILWIDRQLTYRNNFMQDYHSYRLFMHLGAIAAAVPPGSSTCD